MEALVWPAAAVGLVWGTLALRRGGLLGGLLLVMLAGICLGLPLVKIAAGPLPLTMDRILLVVVVAQYAVWRRFGLADPKPLGKPEWTFIALLGALTLRTFTADWTADGYQPASWLILYWAMPFTVYWIARQSAVSERAMTLLLASVTVFGVYLAVTTLAEWRQIWGLVFPKYIATTATTDGEWIGRGRGPLLHPIGNGVLLAPCLAAVLMWWPRVGRRGKALVVVAAALLLAACYASLTRSVWMSGALTLALVVGLAIPRQWRWPALGGGLAAGALLAAVCWEGILSYKRERHLGAEMAAESAQLRPVLALIAWNMFLDRPLLGCGYGQYRVEHLPYAADRNADLPVEKGRGYIAHNVALSVLAETGLVGLGLLLTLLGLWTCDALRLWRNTATPLWARQQGLLSLATLGAWLVNGMFHDVSVVPMSNMTLCFIAGVTAALRPWTQRAEHGAAAVQ